MNDVPKPKAICPECGSEEAFFHCTLKNSEGEIYDWGTVVTCLECKTPFAIRTKNIGIIGTRRRDNKDSFEKVKKAFLSIYEEGDAIVSGGCPKGGDRFAEDIAEELNLPDDKLIIFKADWNKYGKPAGFIRNTDIAKTSDILIACVAPDRTGGTEDTIEKYVKFHPEGTLILILV